MQTYWLELSDKGAASSTNRSSLDTNSVQDEDHQGNEQAIVTKVGNQVEFNLDDKNMRLISWNKEVLQRLLNQVVQRSYLKQKMKGTLRKNLTNHLTITTSEGKMVIDEVKEIITLPRFDQKAYDIRSELNKIGLDSKAADQLEMYVSEIASMYRDNPCK